MKSSTKRFRNEGHALQRRHLRCSSWRELYQLFLEGESIGPRGRVNRSQRASQLVLEDGFNSGFYCSFDRALFKASRLLVSIKVRVALIYH